MAGLLSRELSWCQSLMIASERVDQGTRLEACASASIDSHEDVTTLCNYSHFRDIAVWSYTTADME